MNFSKDVSFFPFLESKEILLSLDLIQRALKKWPRHLEKDIIKEFYRFAAITDEKFIQARSYFHLARIVCTSLKRTSFTHLFTLSFWQ